MNIARRTLQATPWANTAKAPSLG